MTRYIDTKDFAGQEKIQEALWSIDMDCDDFVPASVMDRNDDGYLDANPNILRILSPKEITTLQSKLFADGFIGFERDFESIDRAYTETLEAGVSQDTADQIFDAVFDDLSWAAPYSYEIIPAVIRSTESKNADEVIEFIECVTDTDVIDSNVVDMNWYILKALLKNTKTDIREKNQFRDALREILESSMNRKINALRLIKVFSLSWKDCYDKHELVESIIKGLARYTSTNKDPDSEVYYDAARLLSKIDAREADGDSVVTTSLEIVQKHLNDETLYQWVALGGSGFLTVFFEKLWKPQRDPSSWIKAQDSTLSNVDDFLYALDLFSSIDLLKGSEFFILQQAFTKIATTNLDVTRYGASLTAYINKFFPVLKPDQQEAVMQILVRTINDSSLPQDRRRTAQFLLRFIDGEFSPKKSEEISKTLQGTPQIEVPAIPTKSWMEDRAITAQLFFYEEDGGRWWYGETARQYRELGWETDTKFEDQNGLNGPNVVVLKRTEHDIDMRIIIVFREPEIGIDADLESRLGDFDIKVHRGHHEFMELTFPEEDSYCSLEDSAESTLPQNQLLLLGACKSTSTATRSDFASAYNETFMISDRDEARGQTNISMLHDIMIAAANGETSWSNALWKYEEDQGIILPDHPKMMLVRYVSEL